ncbi:MAG: hypothetical protein RL376_1664, partial [Verrucomicrobiota bacterium]
MRLNPAWPRFFLALAACCAALTCLTAARAADAIQPGARWFDTKGKPIQAHGGGMLYHQGVYYWYGENKDGPTARDGACGARVDALGVNAYQSRDLINWAPLGLVLPNVPDDPTHDLHPSKIIERPKVLYNAATKKFVMWVHVDDRKYSYARVGVAVADQPAGPFTYLGSFRPNNQ